jgi:DNA-binding response OmpR family regulator
MQLFESEKEKEKELYQAKIDFFINITHEIRTSLTLIKIPLERIIKYGKICEQGYESLILMEKNVSRLIELVDQLMDFREAETEGGSLTSHIETIQENPVLPVAHDYPHKANHATVLVVEDNEEMRYLISSELRRHYNVITAGNGQEALLILAKNTIQLVISDILMPIMDGFELLKEIKTNLEFSHIPVILLTAKITTQARLEGLELGADACIDKPFSMYLLLAQISNLLTNREHIRQFYFKSPVIHMKSMAYSKTDSEFLEKLNTIINEHLGDPNFDVNTIAGILFMSRPTLYRKINAISNLTPHGLIKIARLKKAAELLIQGELKVYEVSEMTGFSSQSYFWSAFIKQFGMSPSKYAKTNRPK